MAVPFPTLGTLLESLDGEAMEVVSKLVLAQEEEFRRVYERVTQQSESYFNLAREYKTACDYQANLVIKFLKLLAEIARAIKDGKIPTEYQIEGAVGRAKDEKFEGRNFLNLEEPATQAS